MATKAISLQHQLIMGEFSHSMQTVRFFGERHAIRSMHDMVELRPQRLAPSVAHTYEPKGIVGFSKAYWIL